jgi:predicted nucleotidyltransferase
VPPLPVPLDRILPPLLEDLRASLGPDLVGAYLYGSAVSGGFDPQPSDLDLVVVTEPSTDDIDFEVFSAIVDRLAAREPDWADRLDITFVGRATLATFREGGSLVEFSHDDSLRRIPTADDWVETWFLVRDADTPLLGPSPRELIPPITFGEFITGAALDVDRLVDKARDDPRDGSVAYRLLTLCRVLRSLESGAICSKDEGAAFVSERFPDRGWVVDAAKAVRRGAGSRTFTQVERNAVSELMAILAEEIRRTGPPAVPDWREAPGIAHEKP